MTLFRFILLLVCVNLLSLNLAQAQENTQLDNYWDKVWSERGDTTPNPFAVQAIATLTINGLNPNELSILDLGAGDGRDSLYFMQQGMSVTAIDIAKNSMKHLKSRAPTISTSVQDFHHLSLDYEQFDVIYAHLSLHYFDDEKTDELFLKAYHALKPGGIIFIKCKSTSDPLYGKGEKIDEDMYKFKHTRHFFSKDYMIQKLNAFKLVQVEESSDAYEGHQSNFIEAIAIKPI